MEVNSNHSTMDLTDKFIWSGVPSKAFIQVSQIHLKSQWWVSFYFRCAFYAFVLIRDLNFVILVTRLKQPDCRANTHSSRNALTTWYGWEHYAWSSHKNRDVGWKWRTTSGRVLKPPFHNVESGRSSGRLLRRSIATKVVYRWASNTHLTDDGGSWRNAWSLTRLLWWQHFYVKWQRPLFARLSGRRWSSLCALGTYKQILGRWLCEGGRSHWVWRVRNEKHAIEGWHPKNTELHDGQLAQLERRTIPLDFTTRRQTRHKW